jgi:hypothetical protein
MKQGEFSQYLLGPLLEVKGDLRRLAMSLLKSPLKRFGTAQVIAHGSSVGLSLDPVSARLLCDQLVIQNIMAWESGGYRVANEAMRVCATDAELLDVDGD